MEYGIPLGRERPHAHVETSGEGSGCASGRELLCDAVEVALRAHPKILANRRPRTAAESIARAVVVGAGRGNSVAIEVLNQIIDWKGEGDGQAAAISHCSENSLSQGISEGISEKAGT